MSDSLVNVNHAAQKEEYPHSVLFMRGKKVVERVASSGYVPTSDAVRYQHVVSNEGEPNEEKYVLIMEPLTMAVLKQMAGILVTSFVIMLILGFAFWYLIHTMLKQKTLDEMKSDFTNNITHELKTPIAVAYAANDAMLNYGMIQHPDKARSYLCIIQEQLQRLSGMVEQILAMSMERRKTMQLHIVDVNVKEALETLVSQHGLKVKSGEAEHKQVHFSNIVSNLIDNAIKYSGDILRFLVDNQNEVVETKTILLELWGDDSFFNTRSLHVFITKLRHKLSDDEHFRIVNVRGIGYKLIL